MYYHPVLETEGWWKRDSRLRYPASNVVSLKNRKHSKCQPLLILQSGSLGSAFSNVCSERNIYHIVISSEDIDITNHSVVDEIIQELNPWALINAAEYESADDAEDESETCLNTNCKGASVLAQVCRRYPLKLVTFSSDLVFDGSKDSGYVESDATNPLNIYGKSKAMAEENILRANPGTLIIRTGNFFSQWDNASFVAKTLSDLKQGRTVKAANDTYISPTYVPDLVNETLDLLLDNEYGVFHLTNDDKISWADFARKIADMSGCDKALVNAVPASQLRLKAKIPAFSALRSEKGIRLPKADDALQRYFEAIANVYQSGAIAV